MLYSFTVVELEPQAANKPTLSDCQGRKENTSDSELPREVHGRNAECSTLAQPLHDSLTLQIFQTLKKPGRSLPLHAFQITKVSIIVS